MNQLSNQQDRVYQWKKFTYTELTKSGGKYQPPFLAHIQNGKEFDLDSDYEGEKDVLLKNLDLTGFG